MKNTLVLCAALLALSACATDPTTGKKVLDPKAVNTLVDTFCAAVPLGADWLSAPDTKTAAIYAMVLNLCDARAALRNVK